MPVENRVVVTEMGAVTPLGTGLETFWEGLVAGRNGIARLTHFDPSAFSSQMAAEVKDFTPEIWIAVSKKTGIEKLSLTTRDISDYDELMKMRIEILDKHGLKLKDIQDVIAGMDPLPGAREFLDWARKTTQIIVVSDTFVEFADPLMDKLARRHEGARIMGCGHRVYKTIDPRATFLKTFSRQIATDTGNLKLYEMSSRIEEIMKRPDYRGGDYLATYFYSFNVRHGPLRDVRVRRALALAVDREALVRHVLRQGQKPAYHFVPPAWKDYTSPRLDAED